MKQTFLIGMLALLTACSAVDSSQPESPETHARASVLTEISESEALAIASDVTGNPSTCDVRSSSPQVSYVLKSTTSTRSSSELPDTLAYVVNYADNDGFAIISSVAIENPVLGFSHTGSFCFENEIAVTNFVNEIEGYLSAICSDSYEDTNTGNTRSDGLGVDPTQDVDPIIRIKLGQSSPWNAQVVTEESANLAGCVAVATALVMTHAKDTLTYHGRLFDFSRMLDLIEAYQNGTEISFPSPGITTYFSIGGISRLIISAPQFALNTYDEAANAMAYLIKYIGEDVNMTYSPSVSSASSWDAYTACVSAGYVIPTGYASYSLWDVISYLQSGHIIYMRGYDYNRSKGHAWVVDGCQFAVSTDDTTYYSTPYLHCDWGWNGSSNGYFNGSVFSASSSRNYTPLNYFAVEIGL